MPREKVSSVLQASETPPASPKKKPYTEEETDWVMKYTKKILKKKLKANERVALSGKTFWNEAHERFSEENPEWERTWQSLRGHFLTRLTPAVAEKLQKMADEIGSGQVKIPVGRAFVTTPRKAGKKKTVESESESEEETSDSQPKPKEDSPVQTKPTLQELFSDDEDSTNPTSSSTVIGEKTPIRQVFYQIFIYAILSILLTVVLTAPSWSGITLDAVKNRTIRFFFNDGEN